jgi:hypothetical protein
MLNVRNSGGLEAVDLVPQHPEALTGDTPKRSSSLGFPAVAGRHAACWSTFFS